MSAATKRDVIDAAMSVAEDVAESRLDPTQLNQAVADECKALFGTVVGQGDSLWDLHCDVARQVLAVGGLSADELSEWLAVARHRAGEPVSSPHPPELSIDPPAGTPVATGTLSPEIDVSESDLDTAPEPEPELEPEQADCGCGSTSPATVVTADGRRIPSRLIIARGRGLPDPGCGPM